jgi:hypothetical protein
VVQAHGHEHGDAGHEQQHAEHDEAGVVVAAAVVATTSRAFAARADSVCSFGDDGTGPVPLGSHASGASVADRHPPALEDHGHLALAAGVLQHLGEVGRGRLDVAVVDRVALRGVGLTGPGGVGSGVLAEDRDAQVAHGRR